MQASNTMYSKGVSDNIIEELKQNIEQEKRN